MNSDKNNYTITCYYISTKEDCERIQKIIDDKYRLPNGSGTVTFSSPEPSYNGSNLWKISLNEYAKEWLEFVQPVSDLKVKIKTQLPEDWYSELD